MNSFLIVLAILALFIVRGVVAEKKRAEEARRKAAQGAAGQRPANSPPARPSGSNAHPAKPPEWDAYGNPIKPAARPAAAQRPVTPPAPPPQWSAYAPPVQAYDSDTHSKSSQRDAYGNSASPSARPAASASGSMTYASMEGVGSQEGMAAKAPSNMFPSMEGMGSQEGTSAYAPANAAPAVFEHQPSAAHHTRYALNRANARQALIYSEILGKPKALRR